MAKDEAKVTETKNQDGSKTHTFTPKRAKRLTLPLFSMAHKEVLYCEVLSEIEVVNMPNLAKSTDKTVPLCDVVDLETGEEGRLIVSAVIESCFKECKGGYIGKKFEIRQGVQFEGRNHRALDIFELE